MNKRAFGQVLFLFLLIGLTSYGIYALSQIAETELRNDFTGTEWYESSANITHNTSIGAYHLEGEDETVYIDSNFTFREDDRHASYDPNVGFSIVDTTDDYFRMYSISSSSIDHRYFFIYANAEWIDDKYIRSKWGGYSSYPSNRENWKVYLWDGKVDYGAYQDTGKLFDRYTELQEIEIKSDTSTWSDTFDVQIDASSAGNETVTIVYTTTDGWVGSTVHGYIYDININENSGGVGNLWTLDFNANDHTVVMDQSGTVFDYGHIEGAEGATSGGLAPEGDLYFEKIETGSNNTFKWYIGNATLNEEQITVYFSDDNTTWDLSQSLATGLNAVNLESLNYTDLYMRHYFSSTSNMPYLYNVSVFYGGETAQVEETTEEITVIPFLGLLVIFSLGVILIKK